MLVSQQACVNATKEIHKPIFWYKLCNVIINKYVYTSISIYAALQVSSQVLIITTNQIHEPPS